MRTPRSHGTGLWSPDQLRHLGSGVVIEPGVLVFHPENIHIGDRVYVGHQAILKAYHVSTLSVGNGTWIGQQAFLHSAGGIEIGQDVGLGPGVKILTSYHDDSEFPTLMDGPIRLAEVVIGDGCDVGIGAIILPGVHLGKGVQVGAGAVVTRDVGDFAVVAGVPARVIRTRSTLKKGGAQ